MKIIIGADFVPTESNIELFESGNAETLVGEELLDLLRSADYRIFNLEVPLADSASPIEKAGPALSAPTATIAGYQSLGVDCVTIANNHIMDQGSAGFFSTVETLDKGDIDHVGGGKNLEEAQKPFVIDKSGKKIGIYACAEHEFSIADENMPGANPFDPLESLDHIVALKSMCDFVIVLYHGGKEYYRYPSPKLQKICRKLVDKGADLVVCQHSHCIGCEEKHHGGTIVYGQGNFLFDHSKKECWQTSLLVQLNENFEVSYIPLEKHGNTVRKASGESEKLILDAFWSRSDEIKDKKTLHSLYAELAAKESEFYLFTISSINRKNFFFRVLNKLTGHRFSKWLLKKKYNKKKLMSIKNYIECEAHNELLLTALQADR